MATPYRIQYTSLRGILNTCFTWNRVYLARAFVPLIQQRISVALPASLQSNYSSLTTKHAESRSIPRGRSGSTSLSPGAPRSAVTVQSEPELLLLDLPPAPAAAGWLHCISSHTKNHHGTHPRTANTEELTWMVNRSLWD